MLKLQLIGMVSKGTGLMEDESMGAWRPTGSNKHSFSRKICTDEAEEMVVRSRIPWDFPLLFGCVALASFAFTWGLVRDLIAQHSPFVLFAVIGAWPVAGGVLAILIALIRQTFLYFPALIAGYIYFFIVIGPLILEIGVAWARMPGWQ